MLGLIICNLLHLCAAGIYVCITVGYGLDGGGTGYIFRQGLDILLYRVEVGSGSHPTSFRVGTGILTPGVKRLGHGAEYLPPSCAEVQNGGAISSFPHMLRLID
jgi:hypothetical protein